MAVSMPSRYPVFIVEFLLRKKTLTFEFSLQTLFELSKSYCLTLKIYRETAEHSLTYEVNFYNSLL